MGQWYSLRWLGFSIHTFPFGPWKQKRRHTADLQGVPASCLIVPLARNDGKVAQPFINCDTIKTFI